MFNRIYLEITNHCNLACSFCPEHQRNTRFLSVDELQHRMHHVAKHTKNVYFHVKGEPLLSPHLREALDAAHLYDLNVHLVTNGLLIDRHGELILNHPATKTITVSLHSYSELDSQTQIKQMESMRHWLGKQRPHHPHIRLRVWDADTDNYHKSRHLIQQLTDVELDETTASPFRVSLLPNRHIQSDECFTWPSLAEGEKYPEGRCSAGMMLAILADGTITPCCLDGEGIIALGNINHCDIDEILASQRYTAFKQGLNDRKPSEALCRCCSYKLRFDPKETQTL